MCVCGVVVVCAGVVMALVYGVRCYGVCGYGVRCYGVCGYGVQALGVRMVYVVYVCMSFYDVVSI